MSYGQVIFSSEQPAQDKAKFNEFIAKNSKVEQTILNRWSNPLKEGVSCAYGATVLFAVTFLAVSVQNKIIDGIDFKDSFKSFYKEKEMIASVSAIGASFLGSLRAYEVYQHEKCKSTEQEYVAMASKAKDQSPIQDKNPQLKQAAYKACVFYTTLEDINSKGRTVLKESGLAEFKKYRDTLVAKALSEQN